MPLKGTLFFLSAFRLKQARLSLGRPTPTAPTDRLPDRLPASAMDWSSDEGIYPGHLAKKKDATQGISPGGPRGHLAKKDATPAPARRPRATTPRRPAATTPRRPAAFVAGGQQPDHKKAGATKLFPKAGPMKKRKSKFARRGVFKGYKPTGRKGEMQRNALHVIEGVITGVTGQPIKVGTDFGGLETMSQALENLCVSHELSFYCEQELHLRSFVADSFKPTKIYKDAINRDIATMPTVDLYVLTPPCQPYSDYGLRMGIADERGSLLFAGLPYIKEKRPKLVLLENVKGLLQGDRKKHYESLVKKLEDLGYEVESEILNSMYNNLPQSRPRLYMVAALGWSGPNALGVQGEGRGQWAMDVDGGKA